MASNIDPTKPSGTQAFGAELRANLVAAKDEIEALQTAASGNMAQFEANDTVRVDDANVTYSRATHGDFVAFLFQNLTQDRTLTLPAEEGRGGALIFVRTRVSPTFTVTVRIEDPANLGTYFEQPVANDFVRVLRKSADSGPGNPQFWDHFALHQSGAREPASWLSERPLITEAESADQLLIRDVSDGVLPKRITLGNLGFGGGGQSWTNGSAFDPTNVDLTSLTIFDPYTQTGTINWSIASSPVTGGAAILRFTSNGGTFNWGSSFVSSNPQVSLPSSLGEGEYLLFLKYMPDWGGVGTNRAIVSISPGNGGEGGGQSWTNGGAFDPTNVDLTSLTILDPYTQTGTINWAVAPSPVTGGTAIVRFTSNGGTLNWGSSFVASNPQVSLPSSLGEGDYLFFFQHMPDWGGSGTHRVVVSISPGGLDAAGNIISGNLAKVVSANGALTAAAHSGTLVVTTGNVTIPTTPGFNCTLRSGGAHTVTFNGTTSPAMVSGDLMSIIVESGTVIQAVLTEAADKVAFS